MRISSGYANDVGVSNEDRWVLHEDEDDWHVYCVIDGHGGKQAAVFVSHAIADVLLDAVREQDTALLESDDVGKFREGLEYSARSRYERLEQQVLEAADDCSGACVTALLVSQEFPFGFAVHLGDCRVVVSRHDELPFAVTIDHQLSSDPRERVRIAATGYEPVSNRVAGLEPTRTLGDLDVKDAAPDAVSCIPEVLTVRFESTATCDPGARPDPTATATKRGGKKKKNKPAGTGGTTASPCMIVLATDGVWGTLDDQPAVAAARRALFRKATPNPRAAATAVTTLARDRGSTDDITTIVVVIEH